MVTRNPGTLYLFRSGSLSACLLCSSSPHCHEIDVEAPPMTSALQTSERRKGDGERHLNPSLINFRKPFSETFPNNFCLNLIDNLYLERRFDNVVFQVWTCILISFRWIQRKGYCWAVWEKCIFNFIRNCIFQGGRTTFYAHWQCIWGSRGSASSPALGNASFLFVYILVGGLWYLNMIWRYLFLMTNGFESIFMCLFTICISLMKCFFKSFAHF